MHRPGAIVESITGIVDRVKGDRQRQIFAIDLANRPDVAVEYVKVIVVPAMDKGVADGESFLYLNL